MVSGAFSHVEVSELHPFRIRWGKIPSKYPSKVDGVVPFLIRFLALIATWFGEDQREDIIKTHVQKRLDYVFRY